MNVVANRETFLPIAVEHVMKHSPEEERVEFLGKFTVEFDADAFDATLARIRRSNVADQEEKILRIFQQCEIIWLWRGDPDGIEHSWDLGIATDLVFENGVVKIKVFFDSADSRFSSLVPINEIEIFFLKCPFCEKEGEDDYFPIIPAELDYHMAEFHPDLEVFNP